MTGGAAPPTRKGKPTMAPTVYIHHPTQSVTWSPGEPQSTRLACDEQERMEASIRAAQAEMAAQARQGGAE